MVLEIDVGPHMNVHVCMSAHLQPLSSVLGSLRQEDGCYFQPVYGEPLRPCLKKPTNRKMNK